MNLSYRSALILAALNACLCSSSRGQDYPSKPIRMITGSAGGSNDFVARGVINPGLTASLGQPIIVDNRSGGATSAEPAAKAAPDGYTVLLSTASHWLSPFFQEVRFDPVRDFTPITVVARGPNVLVVHPSLPVKSVKELIALARTKPGQLNYASGATGSATHLSGALFNYLAKSDIVRIAYKSSPMETAELLSGQVQLSFGTAIDVSPFIKLGRLRALAVTSAQPSSLFPDLPAIAATLPGYARTIVFGIWAPARTPDAIVNRLHQEIVRVVNRPDAKQKLFDTGMDGVGSSPDQFAAEIKADMDIMGKVIKESGIRAQ